ncbi:hypothetical protein Pfo_015947 [Paulownia fortunei]|nr:hypothetical protein Pfo_015947 [Paulownia fortunei]
MSQEANNMQPSPFQIGYPFQEASIASESNANRPQWSYPMLFGTMSPVTRDMHLGGQANNNWSQPN